MSHTGTSRTRRLLWPVCLGLAVFLVIGSGSAWAGVRIHTVTEMQDGDAEGTRRLHYTIWVDGNRLVAEPRRPDGPPSRRRVVFRGAGAVLWLMDTERATYYQLDPESAAETASQIAGLRSGLESGLETLSPEHRARANELLGALAPEGGKPPVQVEVRARGEEGRYADYPCSRYDVVGAANRVAELCMAGFDQGLLARERIAAVPELVGFLGKVLPKLLEGFPRLLVLAPVSAMAQLEGVPLQARSFERGRSETVVREVIEAEVESSRFELPEGYARSWVPPFQ
jgi:hypothetical protein